MSCRLLADAELSWFLTVSVGSNRASFLFGSRLVDLFFVVDCFDVLSGNAEEKI